MNESYFCSMSLQKPQGGNHLLQDKAPWKPCLTMPDMLLSSDTAQENRGSWYIGFVKVYIAKYTWQHQRDAVG